MPTPLKLGRGFSSSMYTEASSSAGLSSSPRFVAVSEKQEFITDFWHQRTEYTQSCIKYYYSESVGVSSFPPPGHNQ